MIFFSSESLFSNENKEYSNHIGVSYSISNETDDLRNRYAGIDWLLVQKNDNLLRFGIEFKVMGSVQKNIDPMLSFAAIPTMILDAYGINIEFGTGAVLNHNNGNKIGKHSIASKFMVSTMYFKKLSLRGGGYILANSPFNGFASIGIMYEL